MNPTALFRNATVARALAAFIGAAGVLATPLSSANAQDAPAVPAQPAAPLSPAAAALASGELPDVTTLMDHLNDLYRAENSHAEMTMSIVTANWDRTLSMESWSMGDDLSLVVVRSPARESGTASLKTEEGLWNYAPRADRLMRVPSGMMSEGWMGSHVSNEDLMRESDYVDDYDSTLEWRGEGDDRTIVVSSVPLPSAAVVYSRIEYTVRAADWVPISTEFYDGDELVRTFAYSDVREVSGLLIPMRMEITPHYAPGESTVMVYDSLEFDVGNIDASTFTPRGLRRVAQSR